MENSNIDWNPVFNVPLPTEFAHWPLDMYLDDDEFRAGYPFSPVPVMKSNDDEKSQNSSPTPDNDFSQSNNSDYDACISTTESNHQINDSSSEEKEKKLVVLVESCLVDGDDNNQKIDTIEQNDYNKQKLNSHQQHYIVDQANDTNTDNLGQSSNTEPSHDVVLN